jgi:dienelactone hydrolase
MHKITSILFVTLLFFQSNTYAQFQKEVIHFESANPFSLSDIITDLDSQEKQQVFGQLTTPVDSLNPNKKYPLIIGVAGSMGWRKHHLDYLKMYQEQGYATFQLNSFKSRGITSTVGSQDEVTIAAVILDAYRALEKLSKHPKINRDKVALTGWSLGGGVTLFAGWLPLKEAITDQVSFAAHLAFYPPCFINPENLSFTKAPIHILIGEADNWTPAKPCIDLVEKLSDKTNISITTYPDAHHGFDSEEPVVWNEKGYSFKDCLFDLTADGDVLMNYLRIPMSNSILQKVGFLFCVDKGVHVGGNLDARKKSLAFAKDFMNNKLLKLK